MSLVYILCIAMQLAGDLPNGFPLMELRICDPWIVSSPIALTPFIQGVPGAPIISQREPQLACPPTLSQLSVTARPPHL